MSLSRRSALVAAALVAIGGSVPTALAQAPLELKITAPAAPGGGWDGASRSLQQVMTATGAAKSVQVVNVPGAGGTVGLAQFVNTAKGDGNQLMTMGITMVGAVLTNKAPVGLDAVTPIARITADPLVVVVPANSPHKSVADVIAYQKAHPDKMSFASAGNGSSDHLTAELFWQQTGTTGIHVPYKGGAPAHTDLMGGQVDASFQNIN